MSKPQVKISLDTTFEDLLLIMESNQSYIESPLELAILILAKKIARGSGKIKKTIKNKITLDKGGKTEV